MSGCINTILMDIFKDFPNFFKKIQDIKISFPQIGGGMGYEVWGLGGWGVENLGNGLWAKGDRNKAFITLKKNYMKIQKNCSYYLTYGNLLKFSHQLFLHSYAKICFPPAALK